MMEYERLLVKGWGRRGGTGVDFAVVCSRGLTLRFGQLCCAVSQGMNIDK